MRPLVILVCALVAAPASGMPITDQWAVPAAPGVPSALGAGGRPAGCPERRWCGCWLAHRLGLSDRALWRARHWARVGAPAAPGCIGCVVVLRRGQDGGHVGIVTGYSGGDPIILSGNHNNAVGVGVYSRARVIAYRWVQSTTGWLRRADGRHRGAAQADVWGGGAMNWTRVAVHEWLQGRESLPTRRRSR